MSITEIVGYLHVLVQSIEVEQKQEPIHAFITFGQIAKVNTTPQPSGSTVNQVFLIEVPKQLPRFVVHCVQNTTILGQCRFDVQPFLQRDGSCLAIASDLFDGHNKKIGVIKLKLTFYSSKWGKLKVRIFSLEFHQQTVKQFTQVKVRVTCGIHTQSTEVRSLSNPFDQTVEVVVLKPGNNLSLEVVHEKGVLASYTIKNVEKSELLCEESKAYQVNLFNHEKPIGFIKYQITWIK